MCAAQCRNKKFESQLTSNILSPIPGNNGPFDCARLVSCPLIEGLLHASHSSLFFFLSFFFSFRFLSFDFFETRLASLSRDVIWKGP